MRVVIQVRIHHNEDSVNGELIDIADIEREGPLAVSTVGLSIDEAKQVLAGIQAHRLLQIRTRVLDHQLDNDIKQWNQVAA